MTESKSKRGGARAGAGRKPAESAAYVTVTIRIRDEHVDLIRDAGNNNASKGVRNLLDELVRLRRAPRSQSTAKPGYIVLGEDED